MKTQLLSLAFLAIFANCSELSRRKKIEPCPSVITNLKEHWHYDDSADIFKISSRELGIQLVRDKNCFIGLSRKSIQKLFGEPNLDRGTGWYYYLTKSCLDEGGPGASGCEYLGVSFSAETGKTTEIGIGNSFSSH